MSSPDPAVACYWILQLCFVETDFVLRSLPCRSASANMPWVDQVISQGELIAVVTRTKGFDYAGDCPLDSVFVFHLSSELPIHNLPLPESFRVLDGEDYLRHDWSSVDSGYLAMYWCTRPEDELHLAILSKDTAIEREVSAFSMLFTSRAFCAASMPTLSYLSESQMLLDSATGSRLTTCMP